MFVTLRILEINLHESPLTLQDDPIFSKAETLQLVCPLVEVLIATKLKKQTFNKPEFCRRTQHFGL